MKTQITLSELKKIVKSEINSLLEADVKWDINNYIAAKKQADRETRAKEGAKIGASGRVRKEKVARSEEDLRKHRDLRVAKLMGGSYQERDLMRTLLGGMTVRQFAERIGVSQATVSRRVRDMMHPMLRRQAGETPTSEEIARGERAARELGLQNMNKLEPRSGSEEHQEQQAETDVEIFLKIAKELLPSESKIQPKELALDPHFQNGVIEFAKQFWQERSFLQAKARELMEKLDDMLEAEDFDNLKFGAVKAELTRVMDALEGYGTNIVTQTKQGPTKPAQLPKDIEPIKTSEEDEDEEDEDDSEESEEDKEEKLEKFLKKHKD